MIRALVFLLGLADLRADLRLELLPHGLAAVGQLQQNDVAEDFVVVIPLMLHAGGHGHHTGSV